MRYLKYIVTLIFLNRAHGKNVLNTFNVGEITHSTYKTVRSLNLSNNNLLRLRRATFNNYDKVLEQLYIINSKVRTIDDGAFYDLTELIEVNLAKNFLTRLNSNIFPPNNSLRTFVVAENMLENINNFNLNYFPKMEIFNISNNKLKTLPMHVIEKLNRYENFSLITDKNPWDCTRGWVSYLNRKIFTKICKQEETIFEMLPTPLPAKKQLEPYFRNCMFWFGATFWVGVIVGNIPLIKRTLFSSEPYGKKDECIQCDFVEEQRRMSGESHVHEPQSLVQIHLATHT